MHAHTFNESLFAVHTDPKEIPKQTFQICHFLTRFVLSGNLHGGSVVASYPFDDSASHQRQGHYSQSEDDSLFRYLALVFSQNHPVMRTGEPNCPEAPEEIFKDGITNGAQWYDVPGKIYLFFFFLNAKFSD